MSPASDRHTSIRSIRYNVLNLPYRVIYDGLVLQQPESRTIYDATGHCHAQLTGYTSYGRFSGDVKLYAGDYIVINDTIDRLITPYGYLRDGVFHSYVHDYQGNIMCVVTEDEVLQTNLYYPDGLPMTISTQPEANSYKYTGKELSLFRGHPVYDFTARHTLPALGNIFRTPDPKAGDFTPFSPYTFCAGDPVNYTDPTGMEPSEIEAAKMCSFMHGYINENQLDGGWKVLKTDVQDVTLTDDSGFRALLFERTVDGVTEYAFVFAGSDGFDQKDWENNFKQLVGKSEQYSKALENAKILSRKFGDKLTFVGYSLGGGMAAASAYETEGRAITFNAAGVSERTVSHNNKAKIDAYIIYRDELNICQNFGKKLCQSYGKDVIPTADGDIYYVFRSSRPFGHDIRNFYEPSYEEKIKNYYNKAKHYLIEKWNKYSPF